MLRRHRGFTVVLTLLVCGSLVLAGCSDDHNPVQAADTDPSPQPDEQLAARYVYWINEMDSFVTTQPNGTFQLDWDGFLTVLESERPNLTSSIRLGVMTDDDARVIAELRNSIPIGNRMILEGGPMVGPEEAAMSQWCSSSWWGRKCCYTGANAYVALAIIEGTGLVLPVVGKIFQGYAVWASALIGVCGGFCTNQTWVGVSWLSCP